MILENLEEGAAELKTLMDGGMVIVTQNGQEEHSKLPAEVNIELNCGEDNISSHVEEVENATPIVSISGVKIVVPQVMNQKKSDEFCKRKTNIRKWYCDICNKRFKFKGRYLIHLSTHEHFTYECNECKERFTFRHLLKSHQDASNHQGVGIIEERKDVKCDVCPELIFQTSEALKKHKSEIHKENKKTNQKISKTNKITECSDTHCCHVCGRIFLQKVSLLLHQDRAHSNNPHFICSICNKSFAHRQLLKKHRANAHSDERPYPCDVCELKFKTKVSLVSHKVTHSNTKMYTCEICGKVLNYLTSLSYHLQSHQGYKPHNCSFCSKSFTQKGNLLEHIRIHTGEKPFKCTVCNKAFKTSSQMKLHTKLHYRVTYKCHVCEKTFIKEETLTKHINIHSMPKEPEPKIVSPDNIDDCLNRVQIPETMVDLTTDDISKQIGLETGAFEMGETLAFDANPQDSSVIYIISKKDYQNLQLSNIQNETFVSNQVGNPTEAFNLY